MKNWKTTLGGILIAASPSIAPFLPPDFQWVSAALLSIGALILGKSASDAKLP